MRALRASRRAAGVCTACGGPLSADGGGGRCAACFWGGLEDSPLRKRVKNRKQGTKAELEELLLQRDCPKARQMGYTITVTASVYVLEGEICGDLELAADAPKHHLDPRRLADAAAGWTLHRQPDDSSSRYTISVRGAPPPRFTLQRLEKHPEPHREDRWVDVTATLQGVQAGGRLRPKP